MPSTRSTGYTLYAVSADQRERRRPRQAGTKSLLCRTRRPWRRKSKNRRQVFVELDEAYNECKVFLEDRGEREFNVFPAGCRRGREGEKKKEKEERGGGETGRQ